MRRLSQLSESCRTHLELALATDDPAEKDYHIRSVMQAGCVEEIPDEFPSD
ncbi:hypothetical protein C479_14283 [Halovivax asiaticus JCM 14624]|uniref:Uncharacterized protein n=1 Tax=Halovivax asiaticus JCM 14624 TaxID=1227490 RepID=M0BFW8_9EURY|nr:hypothetical protein [Halovivax asiaticus]ELZ08514.1 hypothetical protein C479_14283 [Halovivax asiaticus JCM 14624]